MHISVLSTRASFFSSFLLLPPRPFAVYVWHFAWNGNARRERERRTGSYSVRGSVRCLIYFVMRPMSQDGTRVPTLGPQLRGTREIADNE